MSLWEFLPIYPKPCCCSWINGSYQDSWSHFLVPKWLNYSWDFSTWPCRGDWLRHLGQVPSYLQDQYGCKSAISISLHYFTHLPANCNWTFLDSTATNLLLLWCFPPSFRWGKCSSCRTLTCPRSHAIIIRSRSSWLRISSLMGFTISFALLTPLLLGSLTFSFKIIDLLPSLRVLLCSIASSRKWRQLIHFGRLEALILPSSLHFPLLCHFALPLPLFFPPFQLLA